MIDTGIDGKSSAAGAGVSSRTADGAGAGSGRWVGALVAAALAAWIDAGRALWSEPKRLFTARLFGESWLLHAALCTLAVTLAWAVTAAWRRARTGKASRARASACVRGFAVAAGSSAALFTTFSIYAGRITSSRDMGLLLAPAALATLAAIAVGAIGLALGIERVGRSRAWRALPLPSRPLSVLALGAALFALAGVGLGALRPDPDLVPKAVHGPVDPAGTLTTANAPRNVLWIVMDTTRRDSLTVYDETLGTSPHVAALAKEGATFDAASSSATFTLTSHVSMLTGLTPSAHNATLRTQFLSPRVASLPIELARAGFQTAAFVSNRVLRMEVGMHHGFDHYDDMVDPEVCNTTAWGVVHDCQALLAASFKSFAHNGRPHWIEDHQRSAREQNERIFDWLDQNGSQPFFLFVNYYDAHWPYLPAEPWRSKFVPPYSGPVNGYVTRADDYPPDYQMTAADYAHLKALYEAELAQLDAEIGTLIEKLRAMGQLDRTLVVVTADHGEHFGEQGKQGHDELYEAGLAVPLVMRWPAGIPAGLRVSNPVQVIDVCPTVLDLLGLDVPAGLQGRSLLSTLRGEQPTPEPVLAEDYDSPHLQRMARIGPLKLIRRFSAGGGREELYDLVKDPWETRNLLDAADGTAVQPELQRVLPSLRTLIDMLTSIHDSGAQGGPAKLDRQALEVLRALGYVNY